MGLQIDGANLQILDTNGNEEVKFTATASAVNEVTVANAATGSAPSIAATGGDSAINLSLAGKGTGTVIVQANVANVNPVGGIPVIHRITCAALTGDVDTVLTHKSRVIDVHAIATAAGGAGDTITCKNGANAISNALDLNVSDGVVVRAGTLDDAFWDVAASGTLRITGASGVNAEVIVTCIRVA